jgi:hypothetical protein
MEWTTFRTILRGKDLVQLLFGFTFGLEITDDGASRVSYRLSQLLLLLSARIVSPEENAVISNGFLAYPLAKPHFPLSHSTEASEIGHGMAIAISVIVAELLRR